MTKLNIKVYRNLMGATAVEFRKSKHSVAALKCAESARLYFRAPTIGGPSTRTPLLKKHHVIMLNLIGSPGSIRVYKVSSGYI